MVPPRHLEKPRVLYLCGWGRSGTTIIDQVLGEVPGFTSVGELRSLWDTDPATHKCGCGQVVNRCPLWGPLLRAMEQASGYTMEDVASLRDEVARTRHLPRLSAAACRNGHGRASRAATDYGDVLSGIYRALAAATGSGVVVDSSKHPAEALLLAGRSDVDLTVLHVVRDPRGVAFSWSRPQSGDARSDVDHPPKQGVWHSAAWWTAWNAAIETLIRPKLRQKYVVARYEDVMADPLRYLGPLVQLFGGAGADLPLVARHEVVLGRSHTVAGNPSRMRNGLVHLDVDRRWESQMSSGDRRLATAAALPLLAHYGYGVRGRPRMPKTG
jgi:Sulfotransferase domain